ncbi:MAG: protein translocase subunit SecF [Alphaproteobacteria bacterium]|nr:protein translocase subunit SecF [Alphaproteobacteria bacterium]
MSSLIIAPIKLFPDNPKIKFMRLGNFGYVLSVIAIILTVVLLCTRGLNFGIDFTGGTLIEVRFEQVPDLSLLRKELEKTVPLEVTIQRFGSANDVLIRVGLDKTKTSQNDIVEAIKHKLSSVSQGGIQYRRTDVVGPKVGDELIKAGALALSLAIVCIGAYVWFRFEYQFSVGVSLALLHDAVLTLGFFSLTQLEFNLSSVAAVLTIVGYSVNDSVVVYDRIRENLRRFKKMKMADLIDLSLNETFSRTLLTSSTTLLAVIALVWFGGPVIRSFSMAMLFGIVIGTYSSIFVGGTLLLLFDFKRGETTEAVKQK